MVRKVKTGKQRLDRYYHLAKAEGYRSRSAFKLIQLAQKYNIFSKCRSVIDLCAAPGGWLQVAIKNLPMASIIIGVDLVPIKPLFGAKVFQADITTGHCRSLLKKELNNGKVDMVLHDGAPNMGRNWTQDAFNQNELVLSATKLASEFLEEGGIFVSKLFRSSDYNSLLWVFQQIFTKVHATKPQSSRNESAEIFVVCFGYKNPKKVDPRLWDPKFVFLSVEDRDETNERVTAVGKDKKQKQNLSTLLKAKGKRNRGGYEEGDDYREAPIHEFFASEVPAEMLIRYNRFKFSEDEEISNHPLTTPLIKEFCDDLKVLGKGDLYQLMKWRFAVKKKLKKTAMEASHEVDEELKNLSDEEESKTEHLLDEENVSHESDSEEEVLQEIENTTKELKKLQNHRNKEIKKKEKEIERQKKQTASSYSIQQTDEELFKFNRQTKKALTLEDELISFSEKLQNEETEENGMDAKNLLFMDIESTKPSSSISDEEMDEKEKYYRKLDVDFDVAYELRKMKSSQKSTKLKKMTRREKVMSERSKELQCMDASLQKRMHEKLASEIEEEEERNLRDSDEETSFSIPPSKRMKESKENKETLSEAEETKESIQADRWFSRDLFQLASTSLSSLEEEEEDERMETKKDEEEEDDEIREKTVSKMKELKDEELPHLPLSEKQQRQLKKKKEKARKEGASHGRHSSSHVDDSLPELELVPADSPIYKPTDPEEVAEIQALGSLMIQRQKRMDLLDGAFNRYAFDDAPLPGWFVEDEKVYTKPQLPISKELMKEYKAKLKEINARPIRKVLEASARRKHRLAKRLTKAKNEAKKIASSEEFNENTKTKHIQKLYRKAQKEEKRKKVYVVSRRAGGGKAAEKKSGPKSKNSECKAVDRRLKKDKRAMKRKKDRMTGKVKKDGKGKKFSAKRRSTFR
ncbi:ribosomal Rna large subunit methyltransferase J protein [Cardiosporidium cionae]|uniref:Putative rRNA methyltransferase n=1 Tax=Cardiosporidium cionae TaxID=476202 RepID=A0ABQ7JBC0_9APIC|nr:ribosomal Rna large subunit methyltransferase J protein [Cardiosporidium cionae]|eukprot:KAF8821204.1 ribosomal Rna large subunit methyltransferase J protein [Cardiosporidium cionae]